MHHFSPSVDALDITLKARSCLRKIQSHSSAISTVQGLSPSVRPYLRKIEAAVMESFRQIDALYALTSEPKTEPEVMGGE